MNKAEESERETEEREAKAEEREGKAEERKSRAVEEMQEKMAKRQEARRDAERATWTGLNQGTEDAAGFEVRHPGINWGPSYKIRRKRKASKRKTEEEAQG